MPKPFHNLYKWNTDPTKKHTILNSTKSYINAKAIFVTRYTRAGLYTIIHIVLIVEKELFSSATWYDDYQVECFHFNPRYFTQDYGS